MSVPGRAGWTCGRSVPAGQNCVIEVTFRPTQVTSYPGRVTVEIEEPDATLDIALSGVGGPAPEPTCRLSAFPATRDFGVVIKGDQAARRTIQVKNEGTRTCTLAKPTSDAPEYTVTAFPGSLAPNVVDTVTIEFQPNDTSDATYPATLFEIVRWDNTPINSVTARYPPQIKTMINQVSNGC